MQIRVRQRSGTHINFSDIRITVLLLSGCRGDRISGAGWGGQEDRHSRGTSIAPISLRRSSENYISPSGKYVPDPPGIFYFSFVPSPTDTRNTGADV